MDDDRGNPSAAWDDFADDALSDDDAREAYRRNRAQVQRAAKLAAYRELAADEERREAIHTANLQAIDDGML